MADYGAKDREAAEEAITHLLHRTSLQKIKENLGPWLLALPGTAGAVIRANNTDDRSPKSKKYSYPYVPPAARNVTINAAAVFDAFLVELSGATDRGGHAECKSTRVDVEEMVKALLRWVEAVPEREPRFVASVKEFLDKYPLVWLLGYRPDLTISKWLARKGKEDAEFARVLVSSVISGTRDRKEDLDSRVLAASLAVLFNRAHGLSDPEVFLSDLIAESMGAFSQGLNGESG